jgi:polar amino acid transport system substrate-binding protein
MRSGGKASRGPAAAVIAVAACCLLAGMPSAHADAGMQAIQRRGALVVGVKPDVQSWGMQDARAGLVGLEPDLAADLARRLGVSLTLVPVLTAERLPALAGGRIDLLLATLSDTSERRAEATLVQPHYYASGVGVLARREARLRRWEDLRNRRVCGRQGSFYNRMLTVRYGMDIVALYGNAVALPALREGRCDALLYDDTGIAVLLQSPRWSSDFETALPPLFVTPWAVALPAAARGGALEALVSRAVADWHRSGLLLALERKWGIPNSPYTVRMNALWSRRTDAGWYCGEAPGPGTPAECL